MKQLDALDRASPSTPVLAMKRIIKNYDCIPNACIPFHDCEEESDTEMTAVAFAGRVTTVPRRPFGVQTARRLTRR